MTGTKRSNAQRLRDSLEDDIINGRRLPGERLDPEALGREFQVSRTPVREAFQRVGLGQSPGTGFPGEGVGVVPSRAKWLDIERATFAYGYGLSVTALQLAQAYQVIAADGVMRRATL